MHGVKQLALLALGLLATGSMAKAKKTTTVGTRTQNAYVSRSLTRWDPLQVGLETAERSRSVRAEINECVTVNE